MPSYSIRQRSVHPLLLTLLTGALLSASGCEMGAPPGSAALPSTVKLVKGAYDIPYYIEPARDIDLVLREVTLNKLESEYSRFQPHSLSNVESGNQPRRVTAYRFSPKGDVGDVVLDLAAAKRNSSTQICIAGSGCIHFYMRGDVIALRFASTAEAKAYEKALIGLLTQKAGSTRAPYQQHGATFVETSLAVRQANHYCYIVSSWMPDTIEAILKAID